ncbi:MAG: monomeric [FeFe] hydrogenase [Bacilli bacterium]|jgi:ferredoxin hydrogenase large subunit|nr:monomeric [FeFe] hydrogenase [Bacilli bacterium]
MANSFDQLNEYKKMVLQEVSSRAYNGTLKKEDVDDIAYKLIPYQRPKVRCCVYKEREVIRERTYLAMGLTPLGKVPSEGQFVFVLEAACDDCNIHKVRITDNCRKCLFRPCTKACHFSAIYEGDSKMHIDYAKCKACGMCAKACPYGSILLSDRPCHKACPTGALKYYENQIAEICEDDCLNCGRCSASCPFGAISERSSLVPVIQEIIKGEKLIALVAPAIVGQWGNASLKQVYEALTKLGFAEILEVAKGADITSQKEAEEALESKKSGNKITTSCCPAFVTFLEKKFPEVYLEHTSDVLSPMAITARMARKLYPGYKTVFIGPCVAKKAERLLKKNKDNLDYVLTFEEIDAMMKAKGIDPSKLEGLVEVPNGSSSGRNFCNTGGVAASLNNYLAEINSPERLSLKVASGSEQCVQYVKDLSLGKQTEDVLEGMMCEGGCMAGVDSQAVNLYQAKARAEKENINSKETKIAAADQECHVDCYFDKNDK